MLCVAPSALVNQASALNNIQQRVPAGLGLGRLNSLATQQQAQFLIDGGSLLSVLAADARVTEMVAGRPAVLLRLYERFQMVILMCAYRKVFLPIAALTGAGAMLGLLARMPPTAVGGAELITSWRIGRIWTRAGLIRQVAHPWT